MSALKVKKRDGVVVDYEDTKIIEAVRKAIDASGKQHRNIPETTASNVREAIEKMGVDTVDVETIQDLVETSLIKGGHDTTAKKYILYRKERSRVRECKSSIMKMMYDVTFGTPESLAIRRENANIDGDSSMGTMLKYGTEIAKQFNLAYMFSPDIGEAHRNGDIHIHDLDFAALTETCCQINLEKLFNSGFNTGHGFLRTPNSILSYASLTCIAIQSNQNDQHGGQSVPAFDHYMAPGVAKTFAKKIANLVAIIKNDDEDNALLGDKLKEFQKEHRLIMDKLDEIKEIVKLVYSDITEDELDRVVWLATKYTEKETHQAMEALIHNLNTMQSRAGGQTPFSSINYGTDTSIEGRMVMKQLLLATEEGLGNGETAIFPIQIMKLKSGVSFNKTDPNYDIFQLACRVSAKRLFPNFSNLDAEFNAKFYVPGDVSTEATYMGCRTRVLENVYDRTRQVAVGRGNLSYTSINLPRLGILADHDLSKFYTLLDEKLDLVHRQLLERFEYQCKRHIINYPFLMGQGVWIDSDKITIDSDLRPILKHGSLAIGFIGLAETLIALLGVHHGESEEAQKIGLEIITHMRETLNRWAMDEKMNYSLIATPAEGLSGRFVKMDRERFGEIAHVTDKDYYTNSFHVPVYYNIRAARKIDLEAPYHVLCNGGHITYVELDGDPTKNLEAFEKVVRYMHDKGIGYGAVNHRVDRDPVCGYVGVIDDVCPRCGRRDGEPMTDEMWMKLQRLYHLGSTSTCGACGNEAEEADRVPNEV